MNNEKKQFMAEAYKEALKAYSKKEVPIGALVVLNNTIISRAHNCKESTNLITNHAEIIAIQKAAQYLGSWKLDGCELYTTLEPCLMCYSAIKQSRIKRVYVGASSNENKEFSYKKYIEKDSIFLDDFKSSECQKILTKFFKEKRNKKEI